MEDEVHLKERQELMSEVLTAVKNVQSRFGGRSELATEENPAVRQLCNALQNILQHRIATRGKRAMYSQGNRYILPVYFPARQPSTKCCVSLNGGQS